MSQKKQPRKASSTPPAKSVPRRRWLRTGLGITLAGGVLLGVWLVYLDAQVRQAFDGRKWALPAKVYARPLALYPGLLLSPQQLESELKWADYRASANADRPGTYSHQGGEWQINRRAFPFWDGQESARQIRLSLVDGRIARLADGQGEQPLIRLEPQYVGGIFPTHNGGSGARYQLRD